MFLGHMHRSFQIFFKKSSAIGATANKFLLLMNQDEAAKAEVRYSLL